MDNVLIVAWPDRIAKEQAWLDAQIAYFQNFYNLFKAINIPVTLDEMWQILNKKSPDLNVANYFLDDFIADKMVDKTGTPTFNGIPIKRERIKDFIDIPSSTAIKNFVNNAPIALSAGFQDLFGNTPAKSAVDLSLLEIANDTVQRKVTTNDLITARHSHYTKNDKGVQAFNFLMDLNDSIETAIQKINDLKIKNGEARRAEYPMRYMMTETPGGYRPDVSFIRANEAAYPGEYVAG